jgi:hypothetical protein
LRKPLIIDVVSNSNLSLLYEVHLGNFLFLIKDEVIESIIIKLSWLESKANIVEELGIFVLLSVEEESVVVDDVIKQVVKNDKLLDLFWQLVKKFIVFRNGS